MATTAPLSASVLLIEPDRCTSSILVAVLQHAGFRLYVVHDLDAATPMLQRMTPDVIIRDLDVAPAEREHSMQQLAATAPELLRRTVIVTTARRRASETPVPGVFAVLRKPLELEDVLATVERCALATRAEQEALTANSDLECVRRFIVTVPSLRRAFETPPMSGSELFLRAEMRRTVRAISETLEDAAEHEQSRSRAEVLRAASAIAAELGGCPAVPRQTARRNH